MGSHEFEKEKEQEMKERKTSCSIDNFNEWTPTRMQSSVCLEVGLERVLEWKRNNHCNYEPAIWLLKMKVRWTENLWSFPISNVKHLFVFNIFDMIRFCDWTVSLQILTTAFWKYSDILKAFCSESQKIWFHIF
jgi:ribosomal protein S18